MRGDAWSDASVTGALSQVQGYLLPPALRGFARWVMTEAPQLASVDPYQPPSLLPPQLQSLVCICEHACSTPPCPHPKPPALPLIAPSQKVQGPGGGGFL